MSGGIVAQYGFLYQRYVFIKTVLENVGMGKFFVYEGADDIDVSEGQCLSSVKVSDKEYIQVKSGTVTKSCWAKVIGNWLLDNDTASCYKIVLENELSFDMEDEEVIDNVCDYFLTGKDKSSASIANKIYRKFIGKESSPKDKLKAQIEKILTKVSCEVSPLEKIKKTMEEIFTSSYCQDIKIYNIAKQCRYEQFLQCMNKKIDASLSKKTSYVLNYVEFMGIISNLTSAIRDDKFIIDIDAMKKRKKSEAENLIKGDDLREVRQLRMVNQNEGFIVNELVKELLYRDFREVYADSDSPLISNIETSAYSNYQDVRYDLGHSVEPKKIFNETVKRDLPLSIVDNSSIYRNGCYVFLTRDTTDKNNQISWCEEDE